MILSRASPRWAAQPHRMPWDSGPRPVPVLLPHVRIWAHYAEDRMLTRDDLTVPDTLQVLLDHLPGRRWAADTTRTWAPPEDVGAVGWGRPVLLQKL